MNLIAGLLSLICLIFFYGCEKKPVAVVNGFKITEKMLNTSLNERLEEHKSAGVKVNIQNLRRAVLEQIIIERLMLQAADELKIKASDDEVQREIDLQRKALKEKALDMAELKKKVGERLIINKFIDSLMPLDPVSEYEIRDYYKNSTTPFLKPAMFYVRFIQTATEAEASHILNEIKGKNIDFDIMADKLDKEKKVIVSGYGWVQPDFFDFFGLSIASAIKNLKEGSIGGPYKGRDAYYLLKVEKKQAERPETFDEAREKIRGIIFENKREAVITQWIAERKSRAKIIYY